MFNPSDSVPDKTRLVPFWTPVQWRTFKGFFFKQNIPNKQRNDHGRNSCTVKHLKTWRLKGYERKWKVSVFILGYRLTLHTDAAAREISFGTLTTVALLISETNVIHTIPGPWSLYEGYTIYSYVLKKIDVIKGTIQI